MKDRTVVIIGTHSASDIFDLNLESGTFEPWCANEAHRAIGDTDPACVFQLHPRDWREAERRFLNGGTLPEGVDADCFGRNREHVAYLRECRVPVYGQQKWDDMPMSVAYPFEAVTAEVGVPLPPNGARRLWATSTFGYMLALALTEHLHGDTIKRIGLAGVELPIGTQRERLWEWPNLAFYLGMAAGMGIEILLPEQGSSLLSAPHYALEGRPQVYDPDHWWAPGEAMVRYDGETHHLGDGLPIVSKKELARHGVYWP